MFAYGGGAENRLQKKPILRVIARKGAERCGKPVRDPCAGAVPALLGGGSGGGIGGSEESAEKARKNYKKNSKMSVKTLEKTVKLC